MVSDVPICTFLSGGVDSSLVSAICSQELKKQGKQLHTFSFDFVDNAKYFKANAFQPSQDRPYVEKMVKFLDSEHRFLECETKKQVELLTASVEAHDLPCMADIDSSMLYFCSLVKQSYKVALTGECADEIFGGYPWFRDPEIYEKNTFPWSKNFDFRLEILNPQLVHLLPLEKYVACQYEKTLARVPHLSREDAAKKRQREISYLNTSWFMTTLLDRKDRMTMANGLEVRVPFADHRLIEYLYNVPWEYKYHNQEVKGLLRDAFYDYLPDEVLHRKKSPYPKSYNPSYEQMLKEHLGGILKDKAQPIHQLIHAEVLNKLMASSSDYGKPWFGQLMALPQMYAYLIEINYWLQEYQIELKFS